MKKLYQLFLSLLLIPLLLPAQQNYCDFEGNNACMALKFKSGRIDIKAKNPKPDGVNGSQRCCKYIRTSSVQYDNIQFALVSKLQNIILYTTHGPDAPRVRMKVYTSAPPGTMIEIQFAKTSAHGYPVNVHSQYQAYTSKQNEWEELEFMFSQSPKGSLVKHNEVNQVNILFAPDVRKNEVFYFDDLTGPMMAEDSVITRKEKRK